MPYSIGKRLINAEDQAIIQSWSLKPGIGDYVFIGCLSLGAGVLGAAIGGLIGIVIALLFFNRDPTFQTQMHVFLICVGIGLLIGTIKTLFSLIRSQWEHNKWHRNLMATESVEVWHCTASDVLYLEVRVEDDEESTGGYLFQIEDDQMLLIKEGDLDYSLIKAGLFPCDHFEIISFPGKGELGFVISIVCNGHPLIPFKTRTINVPEESLPLEGV